MVSKKTSNSRKRSIRDFQDVLVGLARGFAKAKAPYMVIGGQAVIHHGHARFTHDIDLTLALPLGDTQRIIKVLAKQGIRPTVDDPVEFVTMTHVLPTHHKGLAMRVDMSFTDSEYEKQAIEHGVDVVLDGVAVRFASAEDLVVHKIIAGRAIDHQDVLGILLKNPKIDTAYVRDWLGQFAEVLERPLMEDFERLWAESQKP